MAVVDEVAKFVYDHVFDAGAGLLDQERVQYDPALGRATAPTRLRSTEKLQRLAMSIKLIPPS